jgi:hypothetical protein
LVKEAAANTVRGGSSDAARHIWPHNAKHNKAKMLIIFFNCHLYCARHPHADFVFKRFDEVLSIMDQMSC